MLAPLIDGAQSLADESLLTLALVALAVFAVVVTVVRIAVRLAVRLGLIAIVVLAGLYAVGYVG